MRTRCAGRFSRSRRRWDNPSSSVTISITSGVLYVAEPKPVPANALVRVEDLVVRFPVKSGNGRRFITPVDHVSFEIGDGEVLALVGESGSGKTTIGRALVRILEPDSGKILVDGRDVTHIQGKDLVSHYKNVQMVFQDPFGSLNPVRTVEQHLMLPLKKHLKMSGARLQARVLELLETVGLTPARVVRDKFPHELSGGQRQRVAIARALAVNPKFLVADEPISMLDVSIRAGVLKLMNRLKDEFHLSYLYITHDLASARYFGDRIMVMYGGRVAETGTANQVVKNPTHPYTQLLLMSTPGAAEQQRLTGIRIEAPNLLEGRKGCPYAHRCPLATDICRQEVPPMKVVEDGHEVACHHRP
ncbi:MAG: ABC transporter ATP-binding protein [Alicyclobacillus sp.]|nr:ABC transporter ATP-binding protein [Alicyclobacillus sp.]